MDTISIDDVADALAYHLKDYQPGGGELPVKANVLAEVFGLMIHHGQSALPRNSLSADQAAYLAEARIVTAGIQSQS